MLGFRSGPGEHPDGEGFFLLIYHATTGVVNASALYISPLKNFLPSLPTSTTVQDGE
jgi:hypothetical protein